MNFHGAKKSCGRVPMIPRNGTKKLFTTRFEILGLGNIVHLMSGPKGNS